LPFLGDLGTLALFLCSGGHCRHTCQKRLKGNEIGAIDYLGVSSNV